MKKTVYFVLIIIFLSMLFIMLIFDSFSRFNASCAVSGCSDMSVFFTMLFGFFIAGTFVIIDTIAGYIIIRQRPWEPGQAYKSGKSKSKSADMLQALNSRLEELNRAKEETEKQYYKGKFDAKTFEKMLNKYEQKIIDTKSSIRSLKPGKGPRKRGGD